MPDHEQYRPNVGIVIFNKNANIWIGKRADIKKLCAWQMPQGGIDTNESALKAAIREIYEETGIKSIKHIASINEWIKYKLPIDIVKNKWNGKFVGQMQKWFLFYFFGDDSEVNINSYKNPEFSAWKWANINEIQEMAAPFKRSVYKSVVREFARFAKVAG